MLTRRTLLKSAAVLTASSTLLPNSLFAQNSGESAASLIKKAIPSTGETLPVVGIGTNHYGHGIGEGNDAQVIEPLRQVLAKYAELGGRVLDTSVRYGESENVLGSVIDELSLNEQFFISTKVFSEDVNEASEQMAQSARRLKSGVLDLVSVHSMRNWQSNLPMLQEAKKEGKIRYVGITTSDTPDHQDMIEIMQTQELDFVQVNYSLRDRSVENNILKIAADKGIAVVINRAFHEGELFGDVKGHDVPDWAADFDATSWGQIFIKYVVSHPAVLATIPGTTKLHHLIDNMGAAQGRLPNADQRKQIEEYYVEITT